MANKLLNILNSMSEYQPEKKVKSNDLMTIIALGYFESGYLPLFWDNWTIGQKYLFILKNISPEEKSDLMKFLSDNIEKRKSFDDEVPKIFR